MASVAFGAGIISAAFFTIVVLTAVLRGRPTLKVNATNLRICRWTRLTA